MITSDNLESQNNKQGEASSCTAFTIKAENKIERPNAFLALCHKNFMHKSIENLPVTLTELAGSFSPLFNG